MKKLFITALILSSTQSFATRCLPDQDGTERFESQCEVIVVGTRVPECHVNEPWDYPFTATERNDSWYHVHGWHQSSPKAKVSNCNITYDECKRLAYNKFDKFREVNMCGYISKAKRVEWRFRTFNSERNIVTQQIGSFKK